MANLSAKRIILKNRVKLLRAMENFIAGASWRDRQIQYIAQVTKRIRKNEDAMLALSPEHGMGYISFATRPDHKWSLSKRMVTTIGKYLRGEMEIDSFCVSDQILEQLNYHISSGTMDYKNLPIKIVYGREVTKAYEDDGRWHSCMTGLNANKVELYENNPDKVGLAIFDERARALLWTTDEGQKVLDRIYPNSGDHVYTMQKWAGLQGFIYRLSTTAEKTDISDGKTYNVTVELRKHLPYLDVWKSTNYIGRKSPSDKRLIVLTNGYPSESIRDKFPPTPQCGLCKGFLWEDYERHFTDSGSGPYCEECVDMAITICARCLDIKEPTLVVYMQDFQEYWCHDCIVYDAFQCRHCGHCYSTETGHVLATDDGNIYCENCASALLKVCDTCGTIARNSAWFLPSGGIICSSCIDKGLNNNTIFHCLECDSYDRVSERREEKDVSGTHYYCTKCHERRQAHKTRKTAGSKNPAKPPTFKPISSVFEMPTDRG